MAPHPRVVKAIQAMRSLGIESGRVIPVLKSLLKLYNSEWELIEDQNYRTLVDAIFEKQDDEKVAKNGNTIDEDIEPPPKRPDNRNSKDRALFNEDRGKGIADPEEGEVPRSSLGTSMAELRQSDSGCLTRNRHDIVPCEEQANSEVKRVFHKLNDITNGTEKVKISLLDEIGYEPLPAYVYCPHNITYESAYVHVSLARISDEDCCANCVGDCLSASIPCACARDTGGEFAYTPDGRLNQKFLKTCISMKISPDPKHMFYCQVCPLERAKNARRPGKCKGHVLKKFIKECWRKCGCNMMCGNRVVQRGITRKLQVFLTSEGKGWGLRTLEELPEGAFVCEYIGEILTNIELYERNEKNRGKDKHVYPVLLDGDWTTEETLKDEDALCLDATYYGNVARFINHRCHDGNLIDIPVQVETPDRHYYHLAFFTTRKVNALEELTWDYKIDFDDHNHPIEAFKCRCGSVYCRDKLWRR